MTTRAAAARPSRAVWARRAATIVAWLMIVCAIACAGWQVREWCWRATTTIRFHGDVENALHLGREVNRDAIARLPADRRTPTAVPAWPDVWAAYRATYDRAYDAGVAAMAREHSTAEARYPLDYPPGRLAVATLWVHHLRAEFAAGRGADPREYNDALVAPMLRFNTLHEALAAIGAFALAFVTLRDAGRPRWRATSRATLAAACVWLSPAAILDAHGWPQWDVWALPYTIWATFLATRGRWLAVGALLALSAMFKGQVLIVAPLFAAWPLARGEVGGLARLATGFLATAALCVAPWLLQTTEAWRWMIGVAIGVSAMLLSTRLSFSRRACSPIPRAENGEQARRLDGRLAIHFTLAALAVAWIVAPFVIPGDRALLPLVTLLGLASIVLPRLWRRPLVIALLVLSVATFAAGARFGGSFAWLHVGFQTDRYPSMANGRVSNLPAILDGAWHWHVDDPVPLFGKAIECRSLLRATFYLGLVALGFAAGRASRRGGVNAIVALPAAWALMYALVPQMHERYLIWAAATSGLLAARSVGGLLICAALNAISTAMILLEMLDHFHDAPALLPWYRALAGLQPNVGYAVVTLAATLVVMACARSGRPSAQASGSHPERSSTRRCEAPLAPFNTADISHASA